MWADPLGCIGSMRTNPLNLLLAIGLRTTMRVLYGCPCAVPVMKYSFASYLYFARSWPGASDWTDSYMFPGPVIGPVTVGSVTAVGTVGKTAAGPPRPPNPPPGPPGPPCPPGPPPRPCPPGPPAPGP